MHTRPEINNGTQSFSVTVCVARLERRFVFIYFFISSSLIAASHITTARVLICSLFLSLHLIWPYYFSPLFIFYVYNERWSLHKREKEKENKGKTSLWKIDRIARCWSIHLQFDWTQVIVCLTLIIDPIVSLECYYNMMSIVKQQKIIIVSYSISVDKEEKCK